jgi:hypothetical protein
VGWERSSEALRLIVPPPPAWRRIIGPAIRLVLLTPVVALVAILLTSAVAGIIRGSGRGAGFLVMTLFLLPFAFSAAGLWAGALTRLIRVARRGGQPFRLQVADGVFEIMPSADDPLNTGAWRLADVADARVDDANWSLFVRLARLQVTFRNGDAIVTYVPWPNAAALLPVEAELRRALGLDPAPGLNSVEPTVPHDA